MFVMADSILYVFDRTCNAKKIASYCLKGNIRKAFLCPITTDQDAIDSVVKRISSVKNCTIEILPYLKSFNKKAFSERDSFIRFVEEFGEKPIITGKNLREYFRFPGSGLSMWWLSLIVEKDPLKSDTYHNLIKLLTVLDLQKQARSRVIITDIASARLTHAIRKNKEKTGYKFEDLQKHRFTPKGILFIIHFLKALKHYLYLVYKILVVSINMKGLDFRKEVLKKARYIAFTYFPLIDKEALKEKKFINRYYRFLQDLLEERYRGRFLWFAIASYIDGLNFRKSVKLGRQINLWDYPIYFIEEWVALKDLFVIWVYYFYFTAKFLTVISHISRNLGYSEEHIDVWVLFEEDLFSSFCGGILMSGTVYARVFRNISRRLNGRSTILYLAENKAWERAANFAFHEKKRRKVVGILHTTVPLLFLQFFNSKDGLQGQKTGRRIPCPDYLAANGRIPMELLRESGWDEKTVFLWFAIRYQHLKEHLRNNIPWEKRQNKILVVLQVKPDELEEMLLLVHRAFTGQKDYRVIIKEHYLYPIKPLIKRLNLDFDSGVFTISEENLDELLSESKAMVVTGSSAALEGIAAGCPVIIPRLSSIVDMNPLSGISDLPFYVDGPAELRDVVCNIIKNGESPVPYEKCTNFIENYFEFFNSADELIEKIEKL